MRKRWTTSIAAGLALLVLVAIPAGAILQPPHDAGQFATDGCDTCHLLHNAAGPTLTNVPVINNLCLSCHNDTTARAMSTHAGTKNGGFELSCTNCHDPHRHREPFDHDADGGTPAGRQFIRDEIKLPGSMIDCGSSCGAGLHPDPASGTCVADEDCVGDCPNAQYDCTLVAGRAVCTCPTRYTADCTACAPGYINFPSCTLDTGVCTTDGDPCGNGHGTCSSLGGADCSTACTGGEYNDTKNNGTCTPVEACPGGCGNYEVCDNSHGEAVCICPPGASGNNCQTCNDPGYSDQGGLCLGDACAAETDPCGNGTCINSGTDCTADCPVNEHNEQTTGTCVADTTCATSACSAASCDDTHGYPVCNCSDVGLDPANDCNSCLPGFTFSGGACTGDTCTADAQPCGFGTCEPGVADCSTGCSGAGEEGVQSTGNCVDSTTLCGASACNPNACDPSPGYAVCNCNLGQDPANNCNSCIAGFTFNGGTGLCEANECGVAAGDGQRCGFGDCAVTPGSQQERITQSDDGFTITNANGWTVNGTNGSTANGGNAAESPNNANALQTTIDTQGGTAIVYTVWVAASRVRVGGGGPSNVTLTVNVNGGAVGNTGAMGTDDTFLWYNLGTVTGLAAGTHTVDYICSGTNATRRCAVDGIVLSNMGTDPNNDAGYTPYASANWDDPALDFYGTGGGSATCTCDGGYNKTGEACDICVSGIVLDGVCVGSDPCAGQQCLDGNSNPGTCVLDPSQPGNAVCDCNGSYYNSADPLSCTQCDASSFVCGSCPAGYTGTNCDQCDVGYTLVNGACVATDPCASVTCSGEGTCYIDPAIPGDAVCDCNGTYFGSTPTTCDQCTTPAGLSCDCQAGYTGANCDQCDVGYYMWNGECLSMAASPCAGMGCGPGECWIDNTGTGVCDCPGTYYGALCDQCDAAPGGWQCNCNVGYIGTDDCADCASAYQPENGQCVPRPGACAADPCVNGTCAVSDSAAECYCDGRYYGANCDQCTLPSNFRDIVLTSRTGTNSFADGDGTIDGICEVCHTATSYHKSDGSGAAHNAGLDCIGCHPHLETNNGYGFAPSGGGGGCSCHTSVAGGTRRVIYGGSGDFDKVHPHINKAMDEFDCVICHFEGDDTGTPSGPHMDGKVDLRDPDDSTVNLVSYTDTDSIATSPAGDLTPFCIRCHDANGFNDGNGFLTNVNNNASSGGRTPTNPFGHGAAPLNVNAQFDPANAATHSIRIRADGSSGQKYTSATQSLMSNETTPVGTAAFVSPWNWTSVTDCADCHLPGDEGATPAFSNNAHGTVNNPWLGQVLDGTDSVPVGTDSGTGSNVICFMCHDADSYAFNGANLANTRFPDHDQSAHMDGADNVFANGCLNCHGGEEYGGIHGMNANYTDDDGGGTYTPYRFTRGSGLDLWIYTLNKGNRTCSAEANTGGTNLNCTQHGSKAYGPNFQ